MSRFFISLFFVFILGVVAAQEEGQSPRALDSAQYRQVYGLRVGIDLSRPIRSLVDSDYTGFEIVGDFRIKDRLYLAAELGNENRSRAETFGNDSNPNQFEIYDYETRGSYIKLGVDFNTYQNWYGMSNLIYIGGRYAFSTHTQELNNYRIYDSNRYWSPDIFVEGVGGPEEFSGLNASWLEFLFGIKAEVFSNTYLGTSLRLAYLITNKEADRFRSLWIPGFNKVTEGSNFGVGFNVTLSYLIPIFKKKQKAKEEEEEQP